MILTMWHKDVFVSAGVNLKINDSSHYSDSLLHLCIIMHIHKSQFFMFSIKQFHQHILWMADHAGSSISTHKQAVPLYRGRLQHHESTHVILVGINIIFMASPMVHPDKIKSYDQMWLMLHTYMPELDLSISWIILHYIIIFSHYWLPFSPSCALYYLSLL